jgi:uncharacterized delta-60 repeat protein
VATALLFALTAAPASAAPGDLDPTFGGDGVVTAAPGNDARLHALELSGTTIVGAGQARDDAGCRHPAVARWLADGSPDGSFGSGGVAAPTLGPCDEMFQYAANGLSLAVRPDGGAYVGGSYWNGSSSYDDAVLAAYTPGGALDSGFSGDGWLHEGFDRSAITGLVRLPDGRLVAGGNDYGAGFSNWEVHRHLASGAHDNSFGGDGEAVYPQVAGGRQDVVAALVADGADGTVVAVGDASRPEGSDQRSGVAIGRIRPDGSLDPAFGTAGRTRVEPAGEEVSGRDVVRTSDGGFVVAGAVWPHTAAPGTAERWLLLKFDSAGKLDPTFGAGGRVDGPAGRALGVTVDGAGRVVVSGESGDQLTVARYLANGAPDSSFGSDGVKRTGLAGAGEDVLVQPDGRIVAGGTGSAGGRDVMQLVRLQGESTSAPPPPGTDTTDGEIAGPGVPIGGQRPGGPVAGSGANQQSSGRVTIRIVSSRVTSRGVLVRVTYPRGTDGLVRARLWTRTTNLLLGKRTVAALPGTLGRTFRVPLNRRGKRLLRGGGVLKVRATVVVTGLPAR